MYQRQCDMGFRSMMAGGIFMWIIGIAVIIALVWFFSKQSNNNTSNASSTAIKILEERYASGEIDEAEYLSKRDMLSKK